MEPRSLPKWSPMAQDGGQQGAKCHPKGLREALVPLGACQVDARMRPREPRAGSCTVLRPTLGPKSHPKRSQIEAKSGPKVIRKTSSFQIAFWDRFLSIWGSEKHHFWDLKKDPSACKGCKVHTSNSLEKPGKNHNFAVGAWGSFEQKRFKKWSKFRDPNPMRFLIDFGAFWAPFWFQLWSKKDPERRQKQSEEIKT